MALELPQLVQRLVLDASGFKRGAAEAQASFAKTADAAEEAGSAVARTSKDHDAAAAAAEAAAAKSAKSWKNAGADMADTGKKMSTFITLPLVGVAAAAVKTAGEFEATLNTMAAVAGVPGPELEKLGALAKKMGADTVFSANESAEAMLNLSKAGVSTADIMGGGVQATLSLAAAGGLDLATAATVAGNAMNTFGLEGKDAVMIADALANAANASSADVSDLAMALQQGGLAANAAGLSIQETTAVLAAFADAGLRGSDAGTSLKTFLLNLVPNTKPAREAMADLGLKFTDLEGNMLPIAAISEQLRLKTKDLSDEQKTLALQTIFGTDAYRAALVLSEQGAAGLDAYTTATSRAGGAAEVADARMKGWTGTWEQFKGSLETAALSVGQVVIPAITPLVDKVKELADGFSALNPEQAESAVKLAAVAAAAGPAVFVLGKIVGVLAGATVGLQTMGKAMTVSAAAGGTFAGVTGKVGAALATIGMGPVAAIVAGLVGLGVAFVVAYKKSEEFRDAVGAVWGAVSGFFKGVWEGQLKPIFTDFMRIVEAIKPILIAVGVVFAAAVVGPLVAGALILKGALEGISLVVQVLAAVFETLGRNLGPIWGGIQEGASDVWQAIQTAWDGITGAVNAAWQAMNPVWQGIQIAWDAIIGAAGGLWQAVQGAWDGITGAVNAAWQIIGDVWRAIVGFLAMVFTPAFRLFEAVVRDTWEIIVAVIGAAWDSIQGYWNLIKWAVENILMPVFRELWDYVGEVWDGIGAIISGAWNNVVRPVWDAIQWAVENLLTPMFREFRDTVGDVWDGIGTVISGAWNNVVRPIWDAIKWAIENGLMPVFREFRDLVGDVWGVFTSAARTAWDTVGDIIGAALRTIGGMVNVFLRVVANIADVVGLDHVAGVLRDGADAAAGWGRMAAGGYLGAQAVGAGFRTDGPQAIVGEGNPQFPEYVIPTDPKYRDRATALMLEAHSKMFPQHADGTDRLGVQGGGGRTAAKGLFTGAPGWLENLKEFGGDVLEGIGDALLDAASWSLDQVRKLGRAGLDKAWPLLPVPGGLGGIPPSAMNTVRSALLDMLWDKTPPAPTGGPGGGPGVPYDGSGRIGSGWEQITGYLDARGQDYTVTSTVRNRGDGSLHDEGKAVDMVGDMAAIFRSLDGVPGINELFYDPMGYFWDMGERHSGAIGGHDDHVHAATFDKGGVLWPGWTLAYNGTGMPEVVTAMAAGGRLTGPGGGYYGRNDPKWKPGDPPVDSFEWNHMHDPNRDRVGYYQHEDGSWSPNWNTPADAPPRYYDNPYPWTPTPVSAPIPAPPRPPTPSPVGGGRGEFEFEFDYDEFARALNRELSGMSEAIVRAAVQAVADHPLRATVVADEVEAVSYYAGRAWRSQ